MRSPPLLTARLETPSARFRLDAPLLVQPRHALSAANAQDALQPPQLLLPKVPVGGFQDSPGRPLRLGKIEEEGETFERVDRYRRLGREQLWDEEGFRASG